MVKKWINKNKTMMFVIVMAGIFLSMFVSMFFKFGIIDNCIILSSMVCSCEAMYDFQICNEWWS